MPRKQLLAYHRIFGNSATGSVPTGFNKQLKAAGTSVWTVDTVVPTDSVDTKSLKAAQSGNNGGNFLWDDLNEVGSDDITLQADVLFDTLSGGDGNDGKIGIVARASRNGCYVLYTRPSSNFIRISKFNSALSETVVAASSVISPTLAINTWYSLKFQLSGETLRGKIWVQGTTEPAAWNIDTTDATVTAGKRVGVFVQSGAATWNGWLTNFFSVDTNDRASV